MGALGVILGGWQDLIAKIIPTDRRGRFCGIANFIGNETGILGALALPFLFVFSDFRTGFTMAIGVAALCMLVSWGLLLNVVSLVLAWLLAAPRGYPAMFALSAVVALAGWAVYRFGVTDPRISQTTTAP